MKSKMYIIQNNNLIVTVNEKGATLWSIKDAEGKEYLWQGDPTYWEDRAPNIFPYIARLTDGKYILNGKTYEMDIHGFAKDTVFEAEKVSDTHIIFTTKNTEETYKQYPYIFTLKVSYELVESKLLVTYTVKNEDDKVMYFGVGGHPGFNVPFEENTVFEDYYLEFDSVEDAKRVLFSEDCFVTGVNEGFAMEVGKRITLHHEMFDEDAIVLVDMSHGVKLTSEKGNKAIHVKYPDMPYLGLWHWPKTDAPYICIEPWSSLPSRKGIVEDLAMQPNLISLGARSEYQNQFSIEII